ncbi:MAG TPA: single-stranded DNA-binding protein [Asanoa sp.]|nr:single-stranded DNA-binding protein [Asanoa sp.]
MNQLQVTIVGNLTEEPELRFTATGVAVCAFSLAHNPRVKKAGTDEWVDGEPTFVRCTAWRHLAENVAESLTRGARVVVVGDLVTRSWESDGRSKTPAGQKLTRLELSVQAIGPELAFATAKVVKSVRRGGPADDPWGTATTQRPATAEPAAGTSDDEPPF